MFSIKNIVKSSLMIATSRKYVIWNGKRSLKSIALTFDDGPDPVYTPAILDILKSYKIPATFFLVGSKIATYPELANSILQHGHILGNHTYSHRELNGIDRESISYEIGQTGKVLEECTGYTTSLFRPPKGIISLTMLRLCIKQKLRIIMWSVDPKDFKAESSQDIVEGVKSSRVRGGDIVLLHDKNVFTQEALPLLIEDFRKKGLTFSTTLGLL